MPIKLNNPTIKYLFSSENIQHFRVKGRSSVPCHERGWTTSHPTNHLKNWVKHPLLYVKIFLLVSCLVALVRFSQGLCTSQLRLGACGKSLSQLIEFFYRHERWQTRFHFKVHLENGEWRLVVRWNLSRILCGFRLLKKWVEGWLSRNRKKKNGLIYWYVKSDGK